MRISSSAGMNAFTRFLGDRGVDLPTRGPTRTVQINVGKLCNQTCVHCHVEAGPTRREIMSGLTMERFLEVLAQSEGVGLVDITGGAPELYPRFERLVKSTVELGKRVQVRSNLTVLVVPSRGHLVEFFARHRVTVVASLPCYTEENVDRQRGLGVFEASLLALRRLNDVGYGDPQSGLELDLVYNPLGPALPPDQATLEAAYRTRLREDFGLRFNRLFALTNMPIKCFREQLEREGTLEVYEALLVGAFGEENMAGLMCRDLVSVAWDGRLHDCDFNQMLEMPMPGTETVWDLKSFDLPGGHPIATGAHCFGCTAGSGSSCQGTLT